MGKIYSLPLRELHFTAKFVFKFYDTPFSYNWEMGWKLCSTAITADFIFSKHYHQFIYKSKTFGQKLKIFIKKFKFLSGLQKNG